MRSNNENILVSIIVPTYNRGSLIRKTLDSVIAQTHTNWECIVVDDGSTDNTVEVVKEIARGDSRIQIIALSNNGNANIARNKGIQQAKGAFIAMLDSDDIWLENHLEYKLAAIQGFDGVYSGHIDVIELEQIDRCSRQINASEDPFYFIFFSGEHAQTSSLLFAKTALEKIMWDEDLLRHQDYDLLIRFMSQFNMKYDPNKTVLVNKDPGRKSSFNFKGCLQFYEKYIASFTQYPQESKSYLLKMSKMAVLYKKYGVANQYLSLSHKYSGTLTSLKDRIYYYFGRIILSFFNS